MALAAQGFGRGVSTSSTTEGTTREVSTGSTTQGSTTEIGARQLNALIDRLGLLQLDSVNVFERSHYLPAFARLGAYDRATLDRLTFGKRSAYIEYWAHEAAIIPVSTWPLWRWKMAAMRERDHERRSWPRENKPMLDWLLAEVAERGPIAASGIEHDANKRRGSWWGWSDVKEGLEYLFGWGEVVAAGRTRFERTYALPEQVLPTSILDTVISRDDAHRTLIEMAARSLGIGTATDLADYYRLKMAEVTPAIRDLEDAGVLLPVTVANWNKPAWLHRDARMPRRITHTALLSPFDPVVWHRPRAERMFGFHYRIEIYTPAHKRQFGYYTLPLLMDDALVGRIDLKSDRQQRVLRVQSAWREAGASIDLDRLADLLRQTATWQGLERIEVMPRGDLADGVAASLGILST